MMNHRTRALVVACLASALALAFSCPEARGDLVAHWTFDEGSGSVAHDLVGGNDGDLVNAPAWTSGLFGGALDLNGASQYVNCHNNAVNAALSLTGDLTLTGWVRPSEGIVGTRGTLIGKHYNGEYELTFSDAHKGLMYYHGPNWGQNDGFVGSPVEVDDWYLLAVTRDTSTSTMTGYVLDYGSRTMYTNSWAYGQVAPATTNAVHIGHRTPGGLFFPGLIDDVRVYDHVLTEGQIEALYPEPTTLALLGLGAIGLLRRRRA
jgi:hypothetical protein